MRGMPAEERRIADHVHRYLDRADEYPRRAEGESVLLEHVPRNARGILDIRTGDGGLLAFLRVGRPEMLVWASTSPSPCSGHRASAPPTTSASSSSSMTSPSRRRRFDAVVSSLAIHQLEHERKRSLYSEIFDPARARRSLRRFEQVRRRPIACIWPSPRRSGNRLRMTIRLIAACLERQLGCRGSPASMPLTAIGSGSGRPLSSASSRPSWLAAGR